MLRALRLFTIVGFALVAAAAAPALAQEKGAECPAAVRAGVEKEVPGATIRSCKAETEGGKTIYEVVAATGDGRKLELDVTPEGRVIQVEEKIALNALPPDVLKAMAARYPNAKITGAEKQTRIDEKDAKARKTLYEVAFDDGKGKKEATFAEDGAFVGEEAAE
jgi:uncharacterized membrane protein YkoI